MHTANRVSTPPRMPRTTSKSRSDYRSVELTRHWMRLQKIATEKCVLCEVSRSYDNCILVNFEKYLALGGPVGCRVCSQVRTISRVGLGSNKGGRVPVPWGGITPPWHGYVKSCIEGASHELSDWRLEPSWCSAGGVALRCLDNFYSTTTPMMQTLVPVAPPSYFRASLA